VRKVLVALRVQLLKLLVFAELYKDEAPKSAEALADLAKKDARFFPRRQWVSTKGVGKLPDGVFLVGVSKTAGAEVDAIGAKSLQK
jgi:hypothetical protein